MSSPSLGPDCPAPTGGETSASSPLPASAPAALADYTAAIDWRKKSRPRGQYSRDHAWTVGSITVPATDWSEEVPDGCASAGRLIPEEAFIASIASCHMLGFLHRAIGLGLDVLSYHDHAVGVLTQNQAGLNWISAVTLHPVVTYGPKCSATREAEIQLHKEAHENCFIGQSIKTAVTIICANSDRQSPTT
jgi:organic hydroperoxide reductase OsmC/OhrA